MGVFNKISQGYQIGIDPPITSGLEDFLFLFNQDDFNLIYSPTNPLIIIGIQAVGGAKLYKFTGTNNSFGSSSKLAKTDVGPRFSEELDWNIAGNSTDIKNVILAGGYGRLRAIVVNNYKSGDSAIELYGAVCGLIISDAERTAADETIEGGWKLKLTQPNKLREPYPPRSVFIPVSPVGISAPVPTISTARVGTSVPTGVTATPSATGGTLTAQTYFYKVVSVDGQGTTTGSTEASATTSGTTGSVTIAWTAAPGAVSYRVYKGTTTNTESSYFTTTSLNYIDTGAAGTSGSVPSTTTAYATTAVPGTVAAAAAAGGGLASQAWYYRVTSLDALGETIGSTETTATTAGTNNSVNITWASAAGAVSYNVYRGAAAGAENIFFNTTALSFLDTGETLPATYANTLAVIQSLVDVETSN